MLLLPGRISWSLAVAQVVAVALRAIFKKISNEIRVYQSAIHPHFSGYLIESGSHLNDAQRLFLLWSFPDAYVFCGVSSDGEPEIRPFRPGAIAVAYFGPHPPTPWLCTYEIVIEGGACNVVVYAKAAE